LTQIALRLHVSTTDATAATCVPASSLPMCSQFLHPSAIGLMPFSTRLLSTAMHPLLMINSSQSHNFYAYLQALPSKPRSNASTEAASTIAFNSVSIFTLLRARNCPHSCALRPAFLACAATSYTPPILRKIDPVCGLVGKAHIGSWSAWFNVG